MIAAMNHQEALHDWCYAKRGRITQLARYIECSHDFVRQMSNGTRQIPEKMHKLIPAAMKIVEAEEAKAMKAALQRMKALAKGAA